MNHPPETVSPLAALHAALLGTLVERLSAPNPPTDVLAVARRFLEDNSVAAWALPQPEEARAKLEHLFTLLTDALVRALNAEKPSAAVLSASIAFVASQGITKDAAGHVSTARAVAALGSIDLPFKQ